MWIFAGLKQPQNLTRLSEFMAGLVCERPETLCVLDAGAGVGFDGVFTRLKKQAEDQPISAPGSREM